MNDDGSMFMHGADIYNGITVRQHMALEIAKAMIINPTLYDRDSEGGEVPLTEMAVKVTDKLLQHLEETN